MHTQGDDSFCLHSSNKSLCVCVFDVQGFTGYSLDGKLVHVSGRLQQLFPSDGGRIIVEDVSYVEGN